MAFKQGWIFAILLSVCVSACTAEKCVDGQMNADPTDITKYLQCSNGEWSSKSCWWPFRYYDPQEGKCKLKQPQVVGESCTGTWKKPYPGDCQKYYECSNLLLEVKSCSVMYRFDPQQLTCRFGWFVTCTPTNKAPTDKNGVCTEYTRKSVPENCSQYDECQGGQFVRQNCLFGDMFDMTTLTCTTPELAICDKGAQNLNEKEGAKEGTSTVIPSTTAKVSTTAVPSTTAKVSTTAVPSTTAKVSTTAVPSTTAKVSTTAVPSTTAKVSTTAAPRTTAKVSTTAVPSTTPGRRTSTAICSGSEKIGVADSCKKYLQCQNGQLVPGACRWCKNFDPNVKNCVWSWKYKCTETTTTADPPITPSTGKGPTDSPTASPTTPPTASPTAPPTASPTTSPAPSCHDGDKRVVSCKAYETCTKGTWSVHNCKWLHYVYPGKPECVFAWSSPC